MSVLNDSLVSYPSSVFISVWVKLLRATAFEIVVAVSESNYDLFKWNGNDRTDFNKMNQYFREWYTK